MLLLALPFLIWTDNASDTNTNIFYNCKQPTCLMMLFYPPYPPQWFGPMLVTEFQEIESGHCYRSGLFVQSCKDAKCHLDIGLVFIFLSCKPITSTF